MHSLVGGGGEGGRITVIINHLMFNRVIFVVPRKFSTGQEKKKEQEQAPHRRSWESTGVAIHCPSGGLQTKLTKNNNRIRRFLEINR